MADHAQNLMVNPRDFFKSRVARALANQNVSINDPLEAYVVNLLCEFINPAPLEGPSGAQLSALGTPLALMLKEALDAPPTQKVRILRYLGDSSLYIAGFFQDYFNRKTYDVSYFSSLGASAYDGVSTLIRNLHGDKHFASMFHDLAQHFNILVEVLAEVSETYDDQRPINILAVYDRWNRTHSERLRRILHMAGIIPVPTSSRSDN